MVAPCEGGFSPRQVWEEFARRWKLSPRELYVAQAIFHDGQERAIAQRLRIALCTVHSHIQRLYKKLGVSGHVAVAELVLIQLQQTPQTTSSA
jgi:DNA-binding NarL/FixJ family response regulator